MSNAIMKLDAHPAIDEIRKEMEEIEEYVSKYSLADAIREGSGKTEKAQNWVKDDKVCALSAAGLALRARGLI